MSSIRILFVCFILLLFFNSFTQEESSVSLENKAVVIRTVGVAFLGSGLTEDNAKTLAINDAKRSALERAGTYLESHTTVLNSKIEKDEIITFTGSLLKVKPLNFTRILVDNMFAIKAEIEATVDIKLLDQRIEDIRKDTSYREQMELQREKIEELEAKIAILQSPENLKRNKDFAMIKILSAILTLMVITSFSYAQKINEDQCNDKGDGYLFTGGECINYKAYEGDGNERLILVIHGSWQAGTNILGRYAPFAETLNMNTDITTVAVALPGYSGSSSNAMPALEHEAKPSPSATKEYVEFLGKMVESF